MKPALRPRALALASIALATLVTLASGCGPSSERAEVATNDERSGGAGAGRTPAPAFELSDLDGRPLRLADYRGKVVLVGFWATWCGPCRREVPGLKALQAAYADRGLVILGLSVDRVGIEPVRAFVRDYGITWPNAIADDAVVEAFGSVEAIPTTFVIDRRGDIAHRFVGLQSEERLRAALEPLL